MNSKDNLHVNTVNYFGSRQEIKSQTCPINCEQCLILVPQLNNVWSYLDFCPSEEKKVQWTQNIFKPNQDAQANKAATQPTAFSWPTWIGFSLGEGLSVVNSPVDSCCQNIFALLKLTKKFSWWKRSSQLTTAAHLVSLLSSQQHDHSAYQLHSSELVRPVS